MNPNVACPNDRRTTTTEVCAPLFEVLDRERAIAVVTAPPRPRRDSPPFVKRWGTVPDGA